MPILPLLLSLQDKSSEQGGVDDSLDKPHKHDTAMKDDALLRPEKILDHDGTTTTGPAKSPEKEVSRSRSEVRFSFLCPLHDIFTPRCVTSSILSS